MTCLQYGQRVVKTIKTFEATWRPAGGRIRVVLVREDTGWLAYFCSEPAVTAATILEWAWARAEDELVSRPPWDEEARRPLHADKRKAVQGEILRREIQAALGERPKGEDFQALAMRLLNLAA